MFLKPVKPSYGPTGSSSSPSSSGLRNNTSSQTTWENSPTDDNFGESAPRREPSPFQFTLEVQEPQEPMIKLGLKSNEMMRMRMGCSSTTSISSTTDQHQSITHSERVEQDLRVARRKIDEGYQHCTRLESQLEIQSKQIEALESIQRDLKKTQKQLDKSNKELELRESEYELEKSRWNSKQIEYLKNIETLTEELKQIKQNEKNKDELMIIKMNKKRQADDDDDDDDDEKRYKRNKIPEEIMIELKELRELVPGYIETMNQMEFTLNELNFELEEVSKAYNELIEIKNQEEEEAKEMELKIKDYEMRSKIDENEKKCLEKELIEADYQNPHHSYSASTSTTTTTTTTTNTSQSSTSTIQTNQLIISNNKKRKNRSIDYNHKNNEDDDETHHNNNNNNQREEEEYEELKETNRNLKHYLERILNRIVGLEAFEKILNQDFDQKLYDSSSSSLLSSSTLFGNSRSSINQQNLKFCKCFNPTSSSSNISNSNLKTNYHHHHHPNDNNNNNNNNYILNLTKKSIQLLNETKIKFINQINQSKSLKNNNQNNNNNTDRIDKSNKFLTIIKRKRKFEEHQSNSIKFITFPGPGSGPI